MEPKLEKLSTLQEKVETLEDVEEILVEEDENHQIFAINTAIYIPSLKIAVAPAVFMEKDDNTDEFYADWSGTAVFVNLGNGYLVYDMMEQDSILTTLHNRYNGINAEIDAAIIDLEQFFVPVTIEEVEIQETESELVY